MFRSHTLFVVGAGASCEADMPLGSSLTAEIANLLTLEVEFGDNVTRGDRLIYQALKELVNAHAWGDNNFIKSSNDVAEAMQLALSIDTFLESHAANREFVQLGKLGIARAIALAEGASKLKPTKGGQEPFRLSNLTSTWYYSLARQLFTGVPADRPERAFANVTFVVFNYDRCLQVFLKRAAEIDFRLAPDQAESLISNVTFLLN